MSISVNLAHLQYESTDRELEAFRRMIIEKNKRFVEEKLKFYDFFCYDPLETSTGMFRL
jgi:hypothetical protein